MSEYSLGWSIGTAAAIAAAFIPNQLLGLFVCLSINLAGGHFLKAVRA